MRRSRFIFGVAIALIAVACSDLGPGTGPAPTAVAPRPTFLVELPVQCATPAAAQKRIDDILPQLFEIGGGRWITAIAYNVKLKLARHHGHTTLVRSLVEDFINFTLEAYFGGYVRGGQTPATQQKVLELIYLLYCSNGISPIPDLSGIFESQTTVFVTSNSETTVVGDPLDSAAVRIEQGDVPDNVFGTYISVFRTDQPLPTSLDWYGVDGYKLGAFEFVANPPVAFDDPVLAGVCISFDDAIVSAGDLRLAHGVEPGSEPSAPGNTVVTTAGGTIEIAAYADPSPLGLDCDPLPPPTNIGRGFLGRALHQFAKLIVPERLYAGTTGGSTGGTVRKFSPFAAVDIKLNGTGSSPESPQYIPVGETDTEAPVSVSVQTRNGSQTVAGLAVSFAPAEAFHPAVTATNSDANASSSWTLVAGANNALAALTAPLVFVTPVTFAVDAVQLTAVVVDVVEPQAPPLPPGLQDAPYAGATFTATGGTGGGYTFGVTDGALPAGLALSANGVLSGTPTQSGTFSFTVAATSGPVTGSETFALTVLAPVSITAPASLPDGVKHTAYPSQTFTASGGTGSYSWSVVNGALPAGIALSAGGVLSGTPSTYGTFSFTVKATSGSSSSTRAYTLRILFPVSVTTSSPLPYAYKGKSYSKALQASGGTGSYLWSVTGGALPAGLTLAAGGVLSGTPTTYGEFSFTVRAQSSVASASKTYSLTIKKY